MEDIRSLNHTKWECKYHVVWIPKYRKKTLYVELRKYLGSTFRDLAIQRECQVIEGHLLPDHIHMLISIPPKHAVSQVIGSPERQKCHSDSQDLHGAEKEFYRSTFLG